MVATFLPLILILTGLLPGEIVWAAEFLPYPGATLDKPMSAKATQVARDTGSADDVTVYTTPEEFEKVAAFYKKAGSEYQAAWAKIARKLPDGRDIRVKVFLLDKADDLADSKQWVQVQHPFIGDVEMVGTTPRYKDVRSVTCITYTFLK